MWGENEARHIGDRAGLPSARVASPPVAAPNGTDESTTSVLAALAANGTIAVAKGVAAALTGSPALFAETLHTVADAGNEILLVVALRRSRRPADASHPFGYGPERYYWALLAAIGMFVIGGAVSVWEGIRALVHPPELEAFWAGVAVLIIALVLDGASRTVAVRGLRRQAARRELTVRELIDESADPTILTVYVEDTVDVLGAGLALIALILHKVTGSAMPDAIATLIIGLMLGYVAIRLASRNRALLANQGVPERYSDRLRERLRAADEIQDVARLEAVYLGPAEVLVTAEVVVEPGQDGDALVGAIVRLRDAILDEVPAVADLYLTPVQSATPCAPSRSPTSADPIPPSSSPTSPSPSRRTS
jgi:cation diffusion facilitator family transporter